MSLMQTIRDRLKASMRSGDEIEKNVLRVVLGEVSTLENSTQQGNRPVTDEQISKVLRKIILSNNETLGFGPSEDRKNMLLKENEILEGLAPKLLTTDEILQKLTDVEADIKSAKNEGQAVGVAMKFLKQTKESVDGNDVKSVVISMRS